MLGLRVRRLLGQRRHLTWNGLPRQAGRPLTLEEVSRGASGLWGGAQGNL